MSEYRHPMSRDAKSAYRAPLAYGGHCWLLHPSPICVRCGATVPRWSLSEGLWMIFTERWCVGMVRALTP